MQSLLGISGMFIIAIIFVPGLSIFASNILNATTVSANSISSVEESSISSADSPATTVCIVPDTGYVYLHVVSSTGKGLANISVLESPRANSCFGYPPFPTPIEQETNATGYVSFGRIQSNYYYIITLNYSGKSYNFTLPQGPGEYTMATLTLPVGNLDILLCLPQPASCHTYTNATTIQSQSVATSTSTEAVSPSLHLLSFNQTNLCPPGSSFYGEYFSPWSVTLIGSSYNVTRAQPSGAKVSPDTVTNIPHCYGNCSISFSVPNGTYNYTINPARDFQNDQGTSSGTVTISGSNTTVYVSFRMVSCGTIAITNEITTPSTNTTSSTLARSLNAETLPYLGEMLIIIAGILAVAFVIVKNKHVKS